MPNYVDKIMNIKHGQREVCKECERRTGKKDIDECFKCPFHIIFNLMLAETTS